ncbi:ADP-L-glycero-D-manno-heptose-6-epimerase [Candidatus Burarchaeum australiense]|nr:ADP-L-glycero-D-manno-heptose-6-epimerase [Candidatus Burarchaeum australiense]
MVVLVTGGAGYIGSELIREMSRDKRFAGETIRILDNMFRERYVSLWNLPREAHYEFIEGDIRKKEDVAKAMKDVTLVYDLAGITNAPLSFEREELTRQVNYEGAKVVMEAAAKAGAELIYSSTASVYGPTKGVVDETYDCKPVSPYGKYKLMYEMEMLKAAKEGRVRGMALRLGTVYGWTIGMRFDTVIDRFCYLASIGMPLTIYDSAVNEKRPYAHVKDVVRGFLFVPGRKDMYGGTYNLVGQNAGVGEVVEAIKGFLPQVQVTITSTPSLNQLSYVLDNAKLAKAGFKCEYGLKSGVKDIIDKFEAFTRSSKKQRFP